MNFFLKILIIILICVSACSKPEERISIIEDKNLELQMIEAYEEGLKELEKRDAIYAAKKFNEAELLYPQSIWAPRAALMAAYAYYSQAYYSDTIYELERFLETYKTHPRRDYAYYLLALCHYNQIVDEKRDLEEIIYAKQLFELVVEQYPNTDFALDATFKLEFIEETLAAKEMYIARYYLDKEKWIPAINRFKIVVDDFDTTIYVEEALHRLVELHYRIGLIDEAEKYAKVLGYNYKSGKWYNQSYALLNKEYKKSSKKKTTKEEISIIKKFKKIFK